MSEKAVMGGDTMLEDALSFEALIEIQEGDPAWKRIILTTINWISTNLKGMTFGIAMGATFLTLLKMIRRRGYANGFGNSLLGLVIGTPLGVCVNCAAPIAKGIHEGGARLETTLAAMFSSPTMNIIVLTILFSVFPPYLAFIKVGFTLVFIVLLIPILTRYVFRNELQKSIEASTCPLPDTLQIPAGESWAEAGFGAMKGVAGNLWYIILRTVPLLILAGLLGSIMATLVPLEPLANLGVGVVGVLLFAIVGVFLPVPIAFDVVVCAALLAAGVPII